MSKDTVLVRINPVFWRSDVIEFEGVTVTHEPTAVDKAVADKLLTFEQRIEGNDDRPATTEPLVVVVE